ncbi:MAG: peptidoglycan DD-metalloendopeptidase family protein [Candidatus Moraniibacteriota bacterium]
MGKKTAMVILVSVLAIVAVYGVILWRQIDILPANVTSQVTTPSTGPVPIPEALAVQPVQNDVRTVVGGFFPSLPRSDERVTKKLFGIYITKATSPVQPERFSGYHTGTDFEIFPEETDADVAVSAVCSGKLLSKHLASGYGGVAVQLCVENGQPVTVVYGHMRLASITASVGEALQPGDFLGYLGTGYSAETDGERKHLHLGMHKGTAVNILGYVQSKAALSGWIDACSLVCKSGY